MSGRLALGIRPQINEKHQPLYLIRTLQTLPETRTNKTLPGLVHFALPHKFTTTEAQLRAQQLE